MNQITEDYCSFEISKLLKEKGFYSEDCFAFYNKNGNIGFLQTFGDMSDYLGDNNIDAPTLQMALKWLREVHNIHIITIPYAPFYRSPNHPWEADLVYIVQMFRGIIPIESIGRSIIKLTNEQAVEAAIDYVLKNLI